MRYRSKAPEPGARQRRHGEQGYRLELLLGFLLFLFLAAPLWSQPPQHTAPGDPLTDADQILSFADALFQDGDYFRAITEYKRFLFLHPDDPRAGRVQLQVGVSYLRGQQWQDARQTFLTIAQQHPDPAIRAEAALFLGETAYQQGRYADAMAIFREVAERYARTPVADRALYRLGWSYLQARQWRAAADIFAAIDTASPLYPAALALAEAAREAENLPRKSPTLAGLMSAVIPGTGHFYTGRYRDGTLALFLNAAFLAAGIQAASAGHEAAAGLLLFFEAAWYSGAIYGAVNAAHKYNRDAEDRLLQGLERQYPSTPRSLSRRPPSLVLVHIPF